MDMEPKSKKKLLRGKCILAGEELNEVTPASVLIEDNRIAAVGEDAERKCDENDVIVNLADLTLLPGLIDCHNHYSLDPTLKNYLLRMNDDIPDLTIRAIRNMKTDLLSGITSSRYLGDKMFVDVACKNAVKNGVLKGPAAVVATRGIRATHGHGFVGYAHDGVENIRKVIRENLLSGADFIKIFLTGTLLINNKIPCYFTKEEIEVVVEEAHRADVPVATHCIGGKALDLAIETGIDFIEHGYFITDEQIRKIKSSNSTLILTPGMFFYDPRIKTLPEGLINGHLEQREEVKRRTKAVIGSGIDYGTGTDGNHGLLAHELKILVEFGETPLRALKSVTSVAAGILGMSNETGIIAQGKRADIIGVEGNPIENIDALRKIKKIYQNGAEIL